MKTATHRCPVKHRTLNAVAECIFKRHRPAWVNGEGEYALLAWCRELTVTLHRTPEGAEKAKALIDTTACGGACHREHEVVRISR